MNIHKIGAVLFAAAAGGTLLLSATAVGAAVTPPRGHTGGHQASKSAFLSPAAPRFLSTLPKGYTVVTSDFTAYPSTQVAGAAQCPGTEQPVGGGAVAASSDLEVNLNSSYPAGASWVAAASLCIARHSYTSREPHRPDQKAAPPTRPKNPPVAGNVREPTVSAW